MNTYQSTQPRQRGSIMLVIVVLLVLLAILGTAYIQQARFDRFASTATVKTNLNTVAEATINYIGEVLKNDILSDDGLTLFSPDEGGGVVKDEPYDYPWTNAVADPDGNSIPGYTVQLSSSTGTALGGELDDTWLASTDPDFSTATKPRWSHITNLNGIFLKLPKKNSGSPTTPQDGAIDNASSWLYDTNAYISGTATQESMDNEPPGYETIGADADGDGILDSKWTWAPTRSIDGVSYVMAVRIIDNSSLVNASVATSLVDNSNNFDTSGTFYPSALSYSPADLNFGRFYYTTHVGSVTPDSTELNKFLSFRFNSSISDSLIPVYNDSTGMISRINFWEYGASMYGNHPAIPYKLLAIDDEMHLRYRNGLLNTEFNSVLQSSAVGLPKLMRVHPTKVESSYKDTGASGGTDLAKMQDFFENEPRHQMTVMSGHADYAINLPGETGFQHKSNINAMLDQTTPADLIAPVIERIYSVSTPANLPPHIPTPSATDYQEFADQAAACIVDYADSDNYLTTKGNYSGMEELPVISEAYVQREYTVSAAPDDKADFDDNTWSLTADSTEDVGYAIEIRNPFPYTIKLTDVYLYLNDTKIVNSIGTKFDLAELAGVNWLAKKQVLIVYLNAGTGTGKDDITSLIDATTPPAKIIVAVTTPWPMDMATVDVELRASDSTPTTLGWPYQKITMISWNNTDNGTVWDDVWHASPPAPAVNDKFYWQYSKIGRGKNDLTMLALQDSQFEVFENGKGTNAAYYRQKITRLGQEDKEATDTDEVIATYNFGYAKGTTYVLPTTNQQWCFSSVGFLYQVGELAKLCYLGPSPTMTLAEQWDAVSGTNENLDNFRLQLDNSNPVVSGTNLAISHAQLLLDTFVTSTPRNDGLNNDGNIETADSKELLIPGTININTASQSLLSKILPVPDFTAGDLTFSESIAKEIISYRDMTGSYIASTARSNRANKGIAFTSELIGMNKGDGLADGTEYFGHGGNDNNQFPTTTGTGIDYQYDQETAPATMVLDDTGIVDDREELIMIPSWLMQVCSTRSDIYTAYILIRGYKTKAFNEGPVESRRLIVVFDRSNIISGSSKPKVLGIYEYN